MTLPEHSVPAIFLFSVSATRPPLPSTESRGSRFPGFVGTTSGSDSCVSISPRFVFLRSAIPLARRYPGLPGSWRTPLPACRVLGPRRSCRTMAFGNAVLPSTLKTASTFSSLSFGAVWHGPLNSLSTLRSPGHPGTTQDSLTSDCQSLAGIDTRWVLTRAFAITSQFMLPPSRLALAQLRQYLARRC